MAQATTTPAEQWYIIRWTVLDGDHEYSRVAAEKTDDIGDILYLYADTPDSREERDKAAAQYEEEGWLYFFDDGQRAIKNIYIRKISDEDLAVLQKHSVV